MTDSTDDMTLEDAIVSAWQPQDPQLASHGRWLAWSAAPYGMVGEHPVSAIWIAPADGSSPGRQFTAGACNDSRPRWSPDGRSIAFLSDRADRGTTGLYILPVDGGEAAALCTRKSAVQQFAWSPDGRTIALTSPDEPTDEDERRKTERDDPNVYGESLPNARLFMVDLDSGKLDQIATDAGHIREIAWSPDGSRIACLSSPTPELESYRQSDLVTVDPTSGTRKAVCASAGMPANLTWSPDGRFLCFTSTHDTGISALTAFAVDADGGTPRLIGPNDTETVCAMSLRPAPGSDRLVLAIADGLSTRLDLIDPATGARETLYQPSSGDITGDFSVVDRDATGVVLAVVHSRGDQPPEVHSGTGGDLTRVSDHHANLRSFTFGSQEPFYWTSPDGLQLDGLLIRPPDAGKDPLPTIVHIHGGPYGRYTAGWNLRPGHWAQWLAAHGFAVLMPNYRGGQGHGNAFAKWGHGGVGDMEWVDVMSAVDAAIDRGIADPGRLGIGGWSQGGFLTAWGVTQTNRFKAGVMGAGVSDWGMMVMTSDIPTIESNLGGGKPWDGPGPHRFMQHSPISHAVNASTPLLILHGEEDARVPVSQAIGFHRALMEAGVETDLVTYPREPHGLREANHQRDAFRRVRDWFKARV